MIDQAIIAVTGVLSTWINQDPRGEVRRWAAIIGLVGQPFWLFSTWQAGQLGQFVVSVCVTASFLRGVLVGWPRLRRRGEDGPGF